MRFYFSGFLAALVVTAATNLASNHGYPNMDYAAMWAAGLVHQPITAGQGYWWLGLAIHLLIETILVPLLYKNTFYPALSKNSWLRGLQWGTMLWLSTMILLVPMMGKGIFGMDTVSPLLLNAGILSGHLIYGVAFSVLAGPQRTDPNYANSAWHF